MKTSYKQFFAMLLTLGAVWTAPGCGDDKAAPEEISQRLIGNVYMKPSMAVYPGQTVEFQGRGFEKGDLLVFRSAAGSAEAALKDFGDSYVSFVVPGNFPAGQYTVLVRRGATEQILGYTEIRLSLNYDQIPDREGASVKGVVFCGLEPLAGVRVSDGVVTVTTDENGYYWLASDKYHGYVFASFPSGYEPVADNKATPAFWATLTAGKEVCEQHNFEMRRVDNDRHIVIAAADFHLANRNKNVKDMDQFAEGFMKEASRMIAQSDLPVYTLVLGDMTWDAFWYNYTYAPSNYKVTVSSYPGLMFHAMGNHDNDPYFPDDFGAETAYKRVLGPSYYSMNIGKAHYIVLDNTVYLNVGGGLGQLGDRSYEKYLTDIQKKWLEEDLAALPDKNMPVLVAAHSATYDTFNKNFVNSPFLRPSAESEAVVRLFDGFGNVHFLSGHSHYNMNAEISQTVFEHNTASVCETWWQSGYLSGRSICRDGTPAGYGLYTMDGTDVKWYYKGIGEDRNTQFRSYDMNVVKTHFADPDFQQALAKYPKRGTDDYTDFAPNTVLLNVWNYDSAWKIVVRENGSPIPVERVYERDPLHTLAYDYALVKNGGTASDDGVSVKNSHMFRVVASGAKTALEIEITDRFGNVYKELMRRPKAYEITMR